MSILDRLNRLIRSNLNDAIDGRGRGSVRSALDEMKSSLREARREQAQMRRDERNLVESIREARQTADKWEERAIVALQNDDEDLAREALKEKNAALRKSDRLREQLREHREQLEDIEASLDALEMKLQSHKRRIADRSSSESDSSSSRDARRRRWEREARKRRSGESDDAEAPTEYDEVFDTDSEFETFDRMAGKIDAMEAEIEAMRELSGDDLGDSRRSRLERIFRKLEDRSAGGEADDRDESTSRSDNAGDRRRDRRDDLEGKKRRMDRLSELKDKFGGDEGDE